MALNKFLYSASQECAVVMFGEGNVLESPLCRAILSAIVGNLIPRFLLPRSWKTRSHSCATHGTDNISSDRSIVRRSEIREAMQSISRHRRRVRHKSTKPDATFSMTKRYVFLCACEVIEQYNRRFALIF